MTWEVIDNFHTRAKVFGGWLVKSYEHKEHAQYVDGFWLREQSQEMSVAMAFVPDPNYEWKLGVALSCCGCAYENFSNLFPKCGGCKDFSNFKPKDTK